MPFVSSIAPYRDFLLTIRPRSARSVKQLNGSPFVRDTVTNVQELSDDRNDLVLWQWGEEDRPSPSDRIQILSGYVLQSGVLRGLDPRDADLLGSEIFRGDPPPGNYSLLSARKNAESGLVDVDVLTDPFGLAQIFVASMAGITIVANRYHLAAIALHKLGLSSGMNLASLATSLFADGVIAAQSACHEMPIRGIRMLPADTHLRIRNGAVHFARSAVLASDTDPGDAASYRALIEKGCSEILMNVQAVLNHVDLPHKVLNLTGGIDSRTILAAVRSLGRLSEIRADTDRLADEDDFSTAVQLAAHSGIEYTDVPLGEIDPLTPEEHIATWRSHHLGLYHDLPMPISRNQITPGTSDTIRMIGGCGELYRGYYQKIFPEPIHNLAGAEGLAAVEGFLTSFSTWDLLTTIDRDGVARLVAGELMALHGGTVREKLDSWYLAFRNRFHFGTSAMITRHFSTLAVSPLISPSLLRAARLLPARQREAGQVLHDVIHRLDPELVDLPFSGGGWSTEVDRRPRSLDFAVDVDQAFALWDAATKSRDQATQSTRPLPTRADWYASAADSIERSIALLSRSESELSFVQSPEFAARLIWLKEHRRGIYRWWVSRITAMVDTLSLSQT